MSNLKLKVVAGAGLVLGGLAAALPANAFVYEYLPPIKADPLPLIDLSGEMPPNIQSCWDKGHFVGGMGGKTKDLMCWDPTPEAGEVNPVKGRGVLDMPTRSSSGFTAAVNTCLLGGNSVGPVRQRFTCITTPASLVQASSRGGSSGRPPRN